MWTNESVFYQIYPLGAFGAPFKNDGILEHRILKMEDYIPGLKKLGIDCVLMNPLFQSHTHGYDTIDPKKLDVRLGKNEDLKTIVQKLHDHSIRILLDASFNHVGRGFFAFEDVLEHRQDSKYKDWFHIDFNNNNEYDDHLWYDSWEGNSNLVRLNLKNPEVVNYWLSVISFWMEEFNIDGLRLDVAYCLDKDFIKAVHHFVKERDARFFLLGETLHGDYNMWVNDEMLDSSTNYECYKGLYSSFNTKNLFEICHSLNRQFGKEPWCLYTGKHLFNFVDNHDVVRIASQLENEKCLPLIYTLMMTMPGIPCLYYGSEWGIKGEKNWNDSTLRPEISSLEWNDLTEFIHRLIDIKHEHTALHDGSYYTVSLMNEACIYERKDENETLWICINMADYALNMHIPGQIQATDLLSECSVSAENTLCLEPYSVQILQMIV